MQVFIGYECDYNFGDVFKSVIKVFDDEVKALVWKDDMTPTEQDWREYEKMELE